MEQNYIPELTGESAERFERMKEEAKPGSIDFSREYQDYLFIINKKRKPVKLP